MMNSTPFCPVCGAANDLAYLRCFSCGQLLSPESEARLSQHRALLHDQYQLGACLGSGGFSAVYYARDLLAGGREVAIKRITLQGLNPKVVIEATETFNREVRMISALNHAQVPRLYDHFSDQDHWYLILEYIDGQTLETFLAVRKQQGKPLQREEILAMTLQLCPVLEYLHSCQPPVIFRDLKPSNIMRRPDGSLCLIDFGIARYYQPGQAQDTQRLGSPGYAAPEQYGRAQTTPQADIYSLGALLHFLLSGQDPSDSVPGLPLPPLPLNNQAGSTELEELVTCMLSPNPSKRPSIREVTTALKAMSQQRMTRDTASLWPPSPFQIPQIPHASATGQHHLHLPVQPGPLSSPSAKHHLTRRGMLICLGALSVAAGTGIWWITTLHPQPSSQPSYIYRGHSGMVEAVAWSPDGKRIASASQDGTVQVWDATDGGHVLIYRRPLDGVSGVAWSPDSQSIASISYDGTVQIWDANDGGYVFSYQGLAANSGINGPAGFIIFVKALAWSPDGKRIASTTSNPTVQVWDAADGGHALAYRGHSSEVNTVAWSPDSQRIASASASNDSTVQIWNAANGDHIFTYRGHSSAVSGVSWSPDGKRIASASLDGLVQVWDTADGGNVFTYRSQALRAFKDSLSGYPRVAWSPDGKHIASVGNYMMQVWSATDGGNVFTYQPGDSDAVEAVAWSPDSKRIASASLHATVQVWDVR